MNSLPWKWIVGRLILVLIALVLIGYGLKWISNGMGSSSGGSSYVESSPSSPDAKDRKT